MLEGTRALLQRSKAARECRRSLAGWPAGLNPGPTPLHQLPGLALAWGLGEVAVKDESTRSPLGSFKALGAPDALLAGRHAAALKDFVVISATDGNHGRALAAAARSLGCRCVNVLHAQVSAERETPITASAASLPRRPAFRSPSPHRCVCRPGCRPRSHRPCRPPWRP